MQAPPRLPLPAWLAPAVALAFRVGPAAAQIDLAPPNDLFANRTDLGSPETIEVRQKVLRASTEFGDPVEDSVWWQWTAPHDGWWEIDCSPSEDGVHDDQAVQVFLGDSLQSLVVVPDAGYRVPYAKARRLFHAVAGRVYHFAASSPSHLHFELRPTGPATNISSKTALPLASAESNVWRGEAWSTEVGFSPLILTDGTRIYSPLYWSWTCQESGKYYFREDDYYTYSQPVLAGFRGKEPSPPAQLEDAAFEAQAGEVFTFISGTEYYSSLAPTLQSIRVSRLSETVFAADNYLNPFPIVDPLPQFITPPTNAPHSYYLYWYWNRQSTGWVEFDGGRLALSVENTGRNGYGSPILQNGKYYFWTVPGQYGFSVDGWNWGGTPGTFTLRAAEIDPPSNDTLTKALPIQSGDEGTLSGSFFGATRELGDPASMVGLPRPTVWYRWQPGPGRGVAELYLRDNSADYGALPELRVFSGTDPSLFSEITAAWEEDDGFVPAHWSFPFGSPSATEYYLCLSGAIDQFDLTIRPVPPGSRGTENGGEYVTTLTGTGVIEGSAVFPEAKNIAWFKWTAPANGWMFLQYNDDLEVSQGSTYSNRVALTPEQFSPVVSGQTYWFRSQKPFTAATSPVHRLRLLFSEALDYEPGDDPSTPIPLGSLLPAQTSCRLVAATVTDEERALCRESVRSNLLHGIWYSWTAPPDVDGCSVSAPFAWCDVFADTPGGRRVAFSGNDGLENDFVFAPDPGRTYFLFVQSVSSDYVHAVVPLTLLPLKIENAANNTIENAIRIPSGSFPANGISPARDDIRIFRLTGNPEEPLADPALPDAIHTAWWRWTALTSGPCSVQCLDTSAQNLEKVENTGSRKFTIAVYENATSASDPVRVPGTLSAQRPGGGYYYSVPPGKRFAFRAEAGKTYLLQAASPDEFGGISVSVNLGDAYDTWILSQTGIGTSQSAPEANPAGDGINNLLKFCLGLDPSVPVGGDPNISRVPSAVMAVDGTSLSYQFWSDRFNTGFQIPAPSNASPGIADTARVVAERSPDLSYWYKATDAESLGDNRWRVTLPINGTHPRRFIRLRAEWVRPSPPQ